MPRKETATFATTTMIVHSGRLEALTGKMPVAIIQAVVIMADSMYHFLRDKAASTTGAHKNLMTCGKRPAATRAAMASTEMPALEY
jgi:hypothetical protein